MRLRSTTILLCLLGVAACGDARSTVAGVSAEIAMAAASMSGQDAPIAGAVKAQAAEASGHPGFDTGEYPGDESMRALRSGAAPYEWTGFYMPSPCHPDQGWSGKRETLTKMGYGLAVLYVGQQTWGRKPGAPHLIPVQVSRKVKRRVGIGRKRHTVTQTVSHTVMRPAPPPPKDATCNADFVSADRGKQEGFDAANRAEAEGFPHGTVVFLDIERMDVLHQRMRDYYQEWVRAMLADGRYRPGIYAHTYNVDVIHADVKSIYKAAGRTDDPPFWIAKSAGFDLTKLPHEVGHAFATVWQGILDVEQTWNGRKVKLDVNVAGTHNPSGRVGD